MSEYGVLYFHLSFQTRQDVCSGKIPFGGLCVFITIMGAADFRSTAEKRGGGCHEEAISNPLGGFTPSCFHDLFIFLVVVSSLMTGIVSPFNLVLTAGAAAVGAACFA